VDNLADCKCQTSSRATMLSVVIRDLLVFSGHPIAGIDVWNRMDFRRRDYHYSFHIIRCHSISLHH
jgi:hypothetical protein